jgi:hypothetical protein
MAERVVSSHSTTPAQAEDLRSGGRVDLLEMIRRADQGPPTPTEARVRRAEAARAKAEAKREGVIVLDAIASEWLPAWVGREAVRLAYAPDADFSLTADRITELRNLWGLDDGQVARLGGVASEGELQLVLRQMNGVNAIRARLEARGFAGTLAQLGAMVTDPAALALDAATWGATAPLTRGAKATRLRHLVRGGIAAGATEGSIEGYLASVDSSRGFTDVLLAGTGGFLMGGALGGAFGPRAQRALDRAMDGIRRQILAEELAEGGVLEVTEKGKRLGFTEDATREDRIRVIDALLATGDDGVFRLPGSRPMFILGDEFGDAAERLSGLGDDELGEVAGIVFESLEDAYARYGLGYSEFAPSQASEDIGTVRFGKARFGMAARLGQSPVEAVRRVGQVLVEDVIPRIGADGSDIPVQQAATMWVSRMHRTSMDQWHRSTNPLLEVWARENGHELNFNSKYRLYHDFMEDVGKQVVHGDPELGGTAVEQAAMFYRTKMDELRQLARRYGVKGFDEIEEDPSYFTRMPSGEKIEEVLKRAGRFGDGRNDVDYQKAQDTIIDLIAESMASGMRRAIGDAAIDTGEQATGKALKEITAQQMRRSAEGYFRQIRSIGEDGNYFARAKLFSGRLDEESEKILRLSGLSDAQIERVRRAMAKESSSNLLEAAAERGAPSPARFRTILDEGVSVKAANGQTITMDDLFERNATRVMEIYSRQIYGSAAAARIYQDIARRYDAKVETFDDLLHLLNTQANKSGMSSKDVGRFNADLVRLEAAWRSMMNWSQYTGKNSKQNAQIGRILQSFMEVQFMRLMGLSGIAQVPEMGTVMGEVGLRGMRQQMPALKAVFKRGMDGNLSDEMLQATEAMWGHGSFRMRGKVNPRLDQTDAGFEFQTGRLREVLGRGKMFVADASGMNPMNMFLKRMADVGFVQRMANIAAGTAERPSAKEIAGLGLTDAQFDAVMRNLKEHARIEEGAFGGRVRNPNIEAWEPNARGWFIEAGDRFGTRVVQENDPGQLAAWMVTDYGRVLMQFKSFITSAYEKQFLYGIYRHDARIFSAWAASTVFASIAYMAKMQILAAGRPDREEFLAERLTLKSIAANSFAYAGFASILPGTIDTGLVLAGQQKLFDYGRSTGLASDFLAGNPVVDFVDKVAAMPQAVAAMIESGEISERDVNKLTRVLPGQNLILIGNMLKALGAAAGEESDP